MSISRQLPILWLSLRQFRAGKAVRLVAVFALAPVLLAAIWAINAQGVSARAFLARTFLDLLAPTIFPLAALVLANNAFGNEVADRTLPYLTMKPMSRLRIVVEKFTGASLLTVVAFLVGLVATWAVVRADSGVQDARVLGAMVVAAIFGLLAYEALLLLLSLLVPRALVVGVVYALLWESVLARFLPGIRLLSVRHYTASIFVRLLHDPVATISGPARLSSAIIVLIMVVAAGLLLASARLRRMDLD